MRASRGNVLVRMVETEERFSGALLVIPDSVREKMTMHQMEVLAVGEPELCDDEDCERPHYTYAISDFGTIGGRGPETSHSERVHPIDPRLKPGAWVYVAPRSLVDAGDATEKRYFVRVDDVVGIFVED